LTSPNTLSSFSLSLRLRPPPSSTPFPYTTLFRSPRRRRRRRGTLGRRRRAGLLRPPLPDRARHGNRDAARDPRTPALPPDREARSEEHTSELQSRFDLVCRLLLEKKKQK